MTVCAARPRILSHFATPLARLQRLNLRFLSSLGSCRFTIDYTRVIALRLTVTECFLNVITISINGATRQLPDSTSVAALLDELAMSGKRIALERNGEIVSRSRFGLQQLADGDRLEIVVAVGGG